MQISYVIFCFTATLVTQGKGLANFPKEDVNAHYQYKPSECGFKFRSINFPGKHHSDKQSGYGQTTY